MRYLFYCSFMAIGMQFINYDSSPQPLQVDPKTRTRNNGYKMREYCNETEI